MSAECEENNAPHSRLASRPHHSRLFNLPPSQSVRIPHGYFPAFTTPAATLSRTKPRQRRAGAIRNHVGAILRHAGASLHDSGASRIAPAAGRRPFVATAHGSGSTFHLISTPTPHPPLRTPSPALAPAQSSSTRPGFSDLRRSPRGGLMNRPPCPCCLKQVWKRKGDRRTFGDPLNVFKAGIQNSTQPRKPDPTNPLPPHNQAILTPSNRRRRC